MGKKNLFFGFNNLNIFFSYLISQCKQPLRFFDIPLTMVDFLVHSLLCNLCFFEVPHTNLRNL